MICKLDKKNNTMTVINKKEFSKKSELGGTTIRSIIDFAYGMSFGQDGKHRANRSGGTHIRKNGEIFVNVFQGKLSECAFYNLMFENIDEKYISKPDFAMYQLGDWDNVDFTIKEKKISIKSAKWFSNLLLLEKKDWNEKGQYIPNLNRSTASYDFFVLVRINPSCEQIFKRNKWLYSESVNKSDITEALLRENWCYDSPGYITHDQLLYVIRNNHIIEKDTLLNGTVIMDATNYYVQSGDLTDISRLIENLK